ncbi:lysophospholipid acyltransferase family protein [Ponticaulis profundi]|uniref:Lysophospholipid acyltransferase family protein n=1 Tax=Ponticaulis profundi TaxID=2665222 RepID=A0ABW1S7A2_9PROT
MNFLTSLLFVIWLYGSMVVLGILWLPSLLMPRSAVMLGIRTWARAARWGMKVFCGASTEIRGRENLPDGPALIAPKHQSTMDVLMAFLFLDDPCFVLKKELMYYPIFGMYAAKAGMIAIDRQGSTKTLKDMAAKGKKALADGRSLLIFPEGTRLPPGAEPDYKPGIALLYKELGVPCVPIALNTGYCWPARGITRHPGEMVIEILPSIEPGLQRKAFMKTLTEQLESGTSKLLEEGQRAQAAIGVSA